MGEKNFFQKSFSPPLAIAEPLLLLYPEKSSENRRNKLRWAKQYDLHSKTVLSNALIMSSEQEHACGDKYGGFKKRQKIRRKYKGRKHPDAECRRKQPQKLTKSDMAHLYFLPANVFNRIICRAAQNDHEK